MATWHIWVDTKITASKYTAVCAEFEYLGFTVNTMPEYSSVALSVSHVLESAITLYLLKHGSDRIVITRVV